MAENTGIDTVNDDDLEDEALDRTEGGKFTQACSGSVGASRVGRL